MLFNFKHTNLVVSEALIFLTIFAMFSLSFAQYSPWIQKTDMPTARLGLASSVVDSKIYAIGGYRAANQFAPEFKRVEEYDPATDTWTTKASMPTGRHWLTASTANGKIYAIGGWVNPSDPGLSIVEEYDPVSNTWAKKTNMPTARLGLTSCVVDGIIYVIGGASTISNTLSVLETYDPETDTWIQKANMPTKRLFLSACAVDGKIYVIGGSSGTETSSLSTVEEYNPATDTWTKKSDMPTARYACAVSVVNGKIYVIGGRRGNEILSPVEEYDPATDTWARRAEMPEIRAAFSSSTVNGKIYAIGGVITAPPPHPAVKTVEEYTPSADLMTLIDHIKLSKCYLMPDTDSVCIIAKLNDPTGITILTEIEAPDHTPLDSLQLFDDGSHNDGTAGDGLFANVWPLTSVEERPYYVDLQLTKIDTDTLVQCIDNMTLFTTVGPLVFEELTFGSSDIEPNPGDEITFKITLKNNGSIASAPDVKAKLLSLDTLVTVINNNRPFKDIEAGNSKTSLLFKVKISENCPDSTEVKFAMDISSNDYPFWRDTCSIFVVHPATMINAKESIPRQLILNQNYPNPFNPKTVISYSLPVTCDVELSLYNILGQKIVTLVNKQQNAGSYEVNFDASNLSSGIYIYNLHGDGVDISKKMVVMK